MKYKLFLSICFLLMTLWACQSDNKVPTKSLDDLMDDNEVWNKIDSTKEDSLRSLIKIDENFLRLTQKMKIDTTAIQPIDTFLYVDRYDNVFSHKYWVNDNGKKILYSSWEFRDKKSSMNAFMNWLQCYGKNCHTLHLNDSTNVSKENMAMILGGNKLFYLYNVSSESYQLFVQSLLDNGEIKMIDYTFCQDGKKRKGIKWYDKKFFLKKQN